MKSLKEQIAELQVRGYSAVLASAKVVHDVVLLAISRSGFKAKTDVMRMLDIIFSARPFLRRLRNAKANWLQIDPEAAIAGINRLIKRM